MCEKNEQVMNEIILKAIERHQQLVTTLQSEAQNDDVPVMDIARAIVTLRDVMQGYSHDSEPVKALQIIIGELESCYSRPVVCQQQPARAARMIQVITLDAFITKMNVNAELVPRQRPTRTKIRNEYRHAAIHAREYLMQGSYMPRKEMAENAK